MDKRVALIATTFNCKDELDPSLKTFTLPAILKLLHEIVIVDGGSEDGTWELLNEWASKVTKLNVYQVPGANIPRGRNEAIKRADADIIVTFDSGTRYDDDWLKLMIKPFENDDVSVVGGLTVCCGETIFEKCFAAFGYQRRAAVNPSHRGCAFYKKVWESIGGYPEHVKGGEDTWFNTQWKKMGYKYVNVPEAKNFWTVRGTWKGVFKMQRRNTKGHMILGEKSGTATVVFITAVYVFCGLCLFGGLYDHWIWYIAAALYAAFVVERMLTKGRWGTFVNPVKFLVGLYALTASDLGMTLGALEGSILFLWKKAKTWRTSGHE